MADGISREPPHNDAVRVYQIDELRERSKRVSISDEAVSNFDFLLSENFNPKRPGRVAGTDEDVLNYNRLNSLPGFRVCLSIWLNSAQIDPNEMDDPFALEFESNKGIITRTRIGESVVENLGFSASETAKSTIKKRYDRAVDASVYFDLIREHEISRANKKPLLATQNLNNLMDAVTYFNCDRSLDLDLKPKRPDEGDASDTKDDLS
ncbi:MAG: hypothetical protein AAFR03_00450 [Pseudomonadota bacterium]